MFKKILTGMTVLTIAAGCQAEDVSQPKETDPIPTPEEEEVVIIEFPDEYLEKLDEGAAVGQLQAALNEIGYEIEETGIYDDATTWALTDFQLQQEDIQVTGVYDEETKELLEEMLSEEQTIEAGAGLPEPAEPAVTDYGTAVIANPYDQIALVNKEYALPADYDPEDLVVPDVPFPFEEDLPQKQLREVAANALEDLFQAAEEAGLELFAQSGYRSYERQDSIFTMNAAKDGEEAANLYSARPGESEHQTGLAMDVTNREVDLELVEEFGETEEGKWLAENAADFGFIIRFPEGKEEITQYQYEPWHLRYVGEHAAEKIMTEGITLEEYLGAVDEE